MTRRAQDTLSDYVGGVERLQVAYSLERKVCLGGLVLGMLLFAFLTVMTAFGYVKGRDWIPLFAPDGVFMGLCAAALIHYGKAHEALRSIAEKDRG